MFARERMRLARESDERRARLEEERRVSEDKKEKEKSAKPREVG